MNGCISDHPSDVIREKAHVWDCKVTERCFAERLDADDPLKDLRQEFYYPQIGTLPEGIEFMVLWYNLIASFILLSSCYSVSIRLSRPK